MHQVVPRVETLIELFRPDHANDNRQGDAMCDFSWLAQKYWPLLEPISRKDNDDRAARSAWWLCTTAYALGRVVMLYAPRARASAREQPPKIFLPKRKAKGGVGEVAKKMKENFGVANLSCFSFFNGYPSVPNPKNSNCLRQPLKKAFRKVGYEVSIAHTKNATPDCAAVKTSNGKVVSFCRPLW